jgi:hypothetical protein
MGLYILRLFLVKKNMCEFEEAYIFCLITKFNDSNGFECAHKSRGHILFLDNMTNWAMTNAWLFFGSLNVYPPTYLYYVKINIFLSA